MKWTVIKIIMGSMCAGVLLGFAVSCSTIAVNKQDVKEFNQWAGDLTKAKKLLYKENWYRLSGALHGYFGDDLAGLPVETARIIGDIDKKMQKQPLSDFDLWWICAASMRAANPIIREWAAKSMPYFGRDLIGLLQLVGWL